MTREEAKQKLWATGIINTMSKVECDNILNEVYDNFENRTCESCKLFRKSDKACFLSTYNTYIRPVSIGFSGCGKWEQK